MAPKRKGHTPIKGICGYCGQRGHASSSPLCPSRQFISHPAEAYCINVAEQYMKVSRLIIKTMKAGRANSEFIDEAIEGAERLMMNKKTEWKRTRNENLAKNPYVPMVGTVPTITDGMASLFVSHSPVKPVLVEKKKEAQEKKPNKKEEESEEASDGEEEMAVDDEDEEA